MHRLQTHLRRFVAYRKVLLVLPLILLATVTIYVPGLHGPFVFDDQPNITFNPEIALTDLKTESLLRAAMSNDSGLLKRPLPALTFGLNHYIAGGVTDTFVYKTTNLIIHLINVSLVYWLSLLLFKQLYRRTQSIPRRLQYWLPALVTAVWALNPLLLTSVLYVVQRMTSFSALFVLAGLIAFCYGRQRLQDDRRYGFLIMTLGLTAGLLLGIASKENAALLPLLAGVVELAFFDRSAVSPATRRRLHIYYGMIILLPATVALLWLAFHPELILGGYNWRNFTFTQRVLTEARVLWFYVALSFFPRINAFGIFHDDIALSTGLLTPWTTLPALLGLVGAAIAALTCYRRYPVFSFAVLWFIVAHSMESSLIALEIAHEHRNYLPSLSIIMGAIYGLALVIERLPQPRVGIALLLCYISALGFVTYSRAHTWSSEEGIIENAARSHPQSPRSQYMLAELYAQKRGDAVAAMSYYKRTADLDRTDAHALIKLVITASETTITGPSASMSTGATVPGVPRFVSALRLEGRTSLMASDAIIDEIERRLREEIIHAQTSFTLGLLSSCVNAGEKTCEHLYEKVVSWYQLALNNPKSSTQARSYLASGLARLYLEHGDYARALNAVTQSRQYDPSNVEHWLQEAEVYLQLNQLERAQDMIALTRERFAPLDAAARSKAQDLLTRISTRSKTRDTQ